MGRALAESVRTNHETSSNSPEDKSQFPPPKKSLLILSKVPKVDHPLKTPMGVTQTNNLFFAIIFCVFISSNTPERSGRLCGTLSRLGVSEVWIHHWGVQKNASLSYDDPALLTSQFPTGSQIMPWVKFATLSQRVWWLASFSRLIGDNLCSPYHSKNTAREK